MITKKMLIDFFDHTRKLRDKGTAKFDIDKECRWSYFFVGTDRKNLTKAGIHLEQMGYQFIGFLEPMPEDDDQNRLFLRVDRIERHTVETLFSRNQELEQIAAHYGVGDYDGMDVGAVNGP